MNDFSKIHALYHSSFAKEEIERRKRNYAVINTDFLQDLPMVVRDVLDRIRWDYGNRSWFIEAWEKYRKMVLDAGLGGKIKMPGAVFNEYFDKYELKELEKAYDGASGEKAIAAYHSDMYVDDYIEHHGIKGQKWGIRRYQNEDGTLTPEGIARYGYDETTGKMSEEGRKVYKQDAKEDKKEATQRMLEAGKMQAANATGGKQAAATLLVGMRGTNARSVYDAARAAGEGKLRASGRSMYDISAGDLASLPVNVLIEVFSHKKGYTNSPGGLLITRGVQSLVKLGFDVGITSALHKKGKAASTQEAYLRKKYYKDEKPKNED